MDFDIDGIATINWSGFASSYITDEGLHNLQLTIAEGVIKLLSNFIRNRLDHSWRLQNGGTGVSFRVCLYSDSDRW